jgi:hypothetical protein
LKLGKKRRFLQMLLISVGAQTGQPLKISRFQKPSRRTYNDKRSQDLATTAAPGKSAHLIQQTI